MLRTVNGAVYLRSGSAADPPSRDASLHVRPSVRFALAVAAGGSYPRPVGLGSPQDPHHLTVNDPLLDEDTMPGAQAQLLAQFDGKRGLSLGGCGHGRHGANIRSAPYSTKRELEHQVRRSA